MWELIWAGPFGLSSWFAGLEFIDRKNRERSGETMRQVIDTFDVITELISPATTHGSSNDPMLINVMVEHNKAGRVLGTKVCVLMLK